MQQEDIKQRIQVGENYRTEFKSSFSDEVIIALVAFANAKGGDVFVGVDDKRNVVGLHIEKETVQNWINDIKNKTKSQLIPDVEIVEIDRKKIVVLSVCEYPIKPVSIKGRCYKRVVNSSQLMSISEVADMHLQAMNLSWDFYASPNHSINDIDFAKIERVIEKIRKRNPLFNVESISEFLQKYELQKEDGSITNGCYLLFCKDYSMYTTVQMGQFADEITIKDDDILQSDIFSQVDDIMQFVRKHINKAIIISGTQTENIQHWDYPLEAIREIVLNMIVHRDYRSASDSIIKIFPDHILFYNPGSLMEPITLEKLMKNDYVSKLRNKQIANVFKETGDIEKYGTGVRRVCQMFVDYGLPIPKWEPSSDGMIVTVFLQKKVKTTEKFTEKTTEKTAEKIMDYLKENPYLTNKKLAELCDITEDGVFYHIKRLKQKGIIFRVGPDNGGYWQIVTE